MRAPSVASASQCQLHIAGQREGVRDEVGGAVEVLASLAWGIERGWRGEANNGCGEPEST